ncbi:hypothetical protein CJ672_11610, partial [Arcobacter cryaerophilus gv. occultus]
GAGDSWDRQVWSRRHRRMCRRDRDYATPAAAQEISDTEPELSDEGMDLLADLVDASELEAATRGES